MNTPDIAGLCERLRRKAGFNDPVTGEYVNFPTQPDGPQAADTLERQAAEIERLREALENVLASTVGPEVGAGDGGTFILRSPSPDALRRARAALTGEDT